MQRRHLFDNGYPVSKATLLAGSQILLAVARRSLALSKTRLAASYALLGDTADRVVHSRRTRIYTQLLINEPPQADRRLATHAEAQPGEGAPSQKTHHP